MRFYNREEELKELKRIQQLAFEESSRMTVVTGRRRIGKTSLIMKAVEQTPTVYLFIGRKNEAPCAKNSSHLSHKPCKSLFRQKSEVSETYSNT